MDPFEGKTITGRVIRTLRRGATIYDDTLDGDAAFRRRLGLGGSCRMGMGRRATKVVIVWTETCQRLPIRTTYRDHWGRYLAALMSRTLTWKTSAVGGRGKTLPSSAPSSERIFGPGSDVDLLVTFSPVAPWTLLDLVAIRDDFSRVLGRPVDLIERSNSGFAAGRSSAPPNLTMSRDDATLLDIVQHARLLLDLLDGYDRDRFLADVRTQLAVTRPFEILEKRPNASVRHSGINTPIFRGARLRACAMSCTIVLTESEPGVGRGQRGYSASSRCHRTSGLTRRAEQPAATPSSRPQCAPVRDCGLAQSSPCGTPLPDPHIQKVHGDQRQDR